MSRPIQGDTVLALDRNGVVHPAIAMDIIDGAVTASVWFDQGGQFIHETFVGMTEVAHVSGLKLQTTAVDGTVITPGTWCRREVCG